MSAIIASRQLNMSLQKQDEFIKWLDDLEEKKGWTDYRLSVETGLSSSVFSKARQGILPKRSCRHGRSASVTWRRMLCGMRPCSATASA